MGWRWLTQTLFTCAHNALERLSVSTKTLTQVNGDTDLGAVCADNLGWVWLCQGANVLAYSTQGVRYTLAVPSNLPIAAFNVSSGRLPPSLRGGCG